MLIPKRDTFNLQLWNNKETNANNGDVGEDGYMAEGWLVGEHVEKRDATKFISILQLWNKQTK